MPSRAVKMPDIATNNIEICSECVDLIRDGESGGREKEICRKPNSLAPSTEPVRWFVTSGCSGLHKTQRKVN